MHFVAVRLIFSKDRGTSPLILVPSYDIRALRSLRAADRASHSSARSVLIMITKSDENLAHE